MTLTVLVTALAVQLILLLGSKRLDRPFQGLLLFSGAYFAGGGYLYWVENQGGFFAGLSWPKSELELSVTILSTSTAAVAVVVWLRRYFDRRPWQAPQHGQVRYPISSHVFLLIGWASALYVVFLGSDAGGQRNALTLVAYQFSDMLIAVTVFRIAAQGYTRLNLLLLFAFISYASFVGFRYKLALVLFPLLALMYLGKGHPLKKSLLLVFVGVATVTGFSLLTLLRNKFSGVNFDGLNEFSYFDAVYGFFAEANIIFGLASIISVNLQSSEFAYFQPFADALKELVPRFLYEDRATGLYLARMMEGFYTDEGIRSGTAYPFIGEFAIIFGWVGVAVGVVLFGLTYCAIHRYIRRHSGSFEIMVVGIGLLTGLMAYYHYSRGYTPQITKAYLFILFPYLVMAHRQPRTFPWWNMHQSRAVSGN